MSVRANKAKMACTTARGSAMSNQVKKAKMASATVGDDAMRDQVETAKISWQDYPQQRNEQQS